MKLRAKRLLAVLLATLATLAVAAAPASAATGVPTARAARHIVLPAVGFYYPGDLYYRGSFYSYFDCDAAGFNGVYNGWWSAYDCQSEGGNGIWDLYAG